jgi:DNA-binding transcriptional ArsR family regulator
MLDSYNMLINEERDKMSDRLRHRDAESPGVDDLCDFLSSISDNLWSQRPPGGEGDVSPCLQPVKPLWRQIPMATAMLNLKKATKAALAKNETMLRAKTFQRAAILLKQISDPTRLQVITVLSEGECHVGGLCDHFNMSQPAVSHHLALLRHGGIVDRRRQGKNNFYSLTDTGNRLCKIVRGVVG